MLQITLAPGVVICSLATFIAMAMTTYGIFLHVQPTTSSPALQILLICLATHLWFILILLCLLLTGWINKSWLEGLLFHASLLFSLGAYVVCESFHVPRQFQLAALLASLNTFWWSFPLSLTHVLFPRFFSAVMEGDASVMRLALLQVGLSPWKWMVWSFCYLFVNIQLLAHGIILKTWSCVPYCLAGLLIWTWFMEKQRKESFPLRICLAPTGLYLLWLASIYSTMQDELWLGIFSLTKHGPLIEASIRFLIRVACVMLGLGFLYYILIPRGGGLSRFRKAVLRRSMSRDGLAFLELSSWERRREVALFYGCAIYLSLLQSMENSSLEKMNEENLLSSLFAGGISGLYQLGVFFCTYRALDAAGYLPIGWPLTLTLIGCRLSPNRLAPNPNPNWMQVISQ